MGKQIGEYTHYDTCRFCGSKRMESVIDLGYMPLAGGFLKSTSLFAKEKYYPLIIGFCKNCFLLQSVNAVDKNTLFNDYFYVSSSIKSLTKHFQEVAITTKSLLKDPKKAFIVEIGCNDGGFLKALMQQGFKALGVDPATNIVEQLIQKGMPIVNEFFSEKVAKQIVKKHGKADAIYSFHTLAHIDDMKDVVKGIKKLLTPDGFLAFEVHYVGSLIAQFQYDMIYHEHQYYYSLLALMNFFKQFNMEIFEVSFSQSRAGSMMYFVQNKKTGKRKISKNLSLLLKQEKKQQLNKIETYLLFAKRIQKTKKDLLTLVTNLKKKKKHIVGYGASGRGTVVMNYCGLTTDFLEYIVDDAPVKQGSFTPGIHLKIKSSRQLHEKNRPDYAVLFAWPFVKEVLERNKTYTASGGKFIIPLPKVTTIGGEA